MVRRIWFREHRLLRRRCDLGKASTRRLGQHAHGMAAVWENGLVGLQRGAGREYVVRVHEGLHLHAAVAVVEMLLRRS